MLPCCINDMLYSFRISLITNDFPLFVAMFPLWVLFQQSDEEIENLHKQISNLNEENDMMKLAFSDKVDTKLCRNHVTTLTLDSQT